MIITRNKKNRGLHKITFSLRKKVNYSARTVVGLPTKAGCNSLERSGCSTFVEIGNEMEEAIPTICSLKKSEKTFLEVVVPAKCLSILCLLYSQTCLKHGVRGNSQFACLRQVQPRS